MALCVHCGEALYRCLNERFGATGSLQVKVEFRHESTGYITCPKKEG